LLGLPAPHPLRKLPPDTLDIGDEAVGFKQGRDALGRKGTIGVVGDADDDNAKARTPIATWQFSQSTGSACGS